MTTLGTEPATRVAGTSVDHELAEAVERALWDEPILRGGHSAIEVEVAQGAVTLRGHVLSVTAKAQACEIARHVPGVRKISDHLVADEQLEIDVAQALARDPRTRSDNIRVYVHQGAVDLHGPVARDETCAAAAEVAARVPYVRAVVNHLKRSDALSEVAEPCLAEPRVGQEVTATDMPLGRVEEVIVNPHDRQVLALVVLGHFPDVLRWETGMYPDEMPKQERRVLIPVEAVHNVGEAGVMLRTTGLGAACYPSYDSARYETPTSEPDVPYPYHPGDVLFERAAP